MAESTIITGQFVRISQTPASIGERLLALVIDYFLIVIYVYSTATLLTELRLPSGFTLIFFLCVIYLPILGYSFLCETFNHGQSFGKRIMNIRVGITGEDGKNYFGIGIDHDIIRASIDALESAMNRSLEA